MPARAANAPPAAAAGPAGGGTLALMRALPGLLRDIDAVVEGWSVRAAAIPDAELRRQALASLQRKRFHCEGGGVYALLAGRQRAAALRFIVALQTISDYLDNLCDRSPSGGGADFAALHRAMTDAVDPDAGRSAGDPHPDGEPSDYYRLHPHRDDGGYLASLVGACRAEVRRLPTPARRAFAGEAARLVGWYNALQRLKHLPEARERAVREWTRGLAEHAPDLQWWEVAAATGSTLGVFALFAYAATGTLADEEAALVRRAYFPWVTGLHILLDYWIDRDEDLRGGDLNFAAYYPSDGAAARRLQAFGAAACRAVSALPAAGFHRIVVRGLPALYLADPKVAAQGFARPAWSVLRVAGPATWALYWFVRLLRARGALAPV